MESSGSCESAKAGAAECPKSWQKVLPCHTQVPFTATEVVRDERDAIAYGRAARCKLGLIDEAARQSPLRSGLAISGGGIRSATFALGGLQALAQRKLLPELDYLSTVSGGGYIGSWLAAWIYREGFQRVQYDLETNTSAKEVDKTDPHYLEPGPIHFLRKYTSYLTPKVGLVSGDTWAAAATYGRNLLLNQAILIGCTILALLLPRLLAWSYSWSAQASANLGLWVLFAASWLLAAVFAGFGMGVFDRTVHEVPVFPLRLRMWLNPAWFVVPAMVAAFSGANAIFGLQQYPPWLQVLQLSKFEYVAPIFAGIILTGTLTAVVYAVGAIARKKECSDDHCGDLKPVRPSWWRPALAAVGAGAAVGGMFYLYWQWLPRLGDGGVRSNMLVTTLGPPMLILICVLAGWLQIGVMGTSFPDAKREWMARAAGICMILGLSWVVFSAIALFSPTLFDAFLGNLKNKGWSILVPPAWLATIWSGLKAARSPKTGDKKGTSPMLGWLARLAPPVFIVGLAMILAWLIQYMMTASGNSASVAAAIWNWTPHSLMLLAAALLGASLIFFVDVNEFSMHLFYRNRLVRAYLGASNMKRNPHPFTGFALDDDLMLKDLDPKAPKGDSAYSGPYPLICTALNLVGGDDLAWQERKAASFVYSPIFCGYDHMPTYRHTKLNQQGYRPTCCFSGPDGPHVGTAMAASGAAASPNMGYHSSPAVAVLMTFFDVRLGWWVGNPRDKNTWQNYGPRSFYLMNELLSKTDDESRYLYLSDGGHFENLGVYELVRRRLNLIVCFDGDADPTYEFGDLGNLIERCRRDFGAEIKVRVNRIQPAGDPPLSPSHFAIGKIKYPALADMPESEGWLLYIKSSICGTEPGDVLAYRRAHPDFPHDPTADQFFTESQFESYRALGHHAVLTTLNQLLGANEPVCVEDVIEVLRNLDRLPR